MSAETIFRYLGLALRLVEDLVATGRDPEVYIRELADADPEIARVRAERDAAMDARWPR